MEPQDKAQQEALQESLQRGEAFEELIRTKGWSYVQQFYQNKIKHFASDLLINEKKDIAEFEAERRELIGLRRVLGMIENDIEVLHKENEKAKGPTEK